ncbi:MAG: site-specific integrase [Filimonas sp.]|nr:site-specific integrase [Filimonas sp.]
MLWPLKLVSPKRAIRRDGTALIFIQFCGKNNNTKLLPTGIAVPPAYWNKRQCKIVKGLPAEHGQPEALNQALSTMKRTVEDLATWAHNNQVPVIADFLKAKYQPGFSFTSFLEEQAALATIPAVEVIDYSFFGQFDAYLLMKQKKVSGGTVTILNTVKKHLLDYQVFSGKPISFEKIDYNFYEGLLDFLTYDYRLMRRKQPVYGLKLNSIGKTIKQLRIFLRDRMKRKLIAHIDLSDFKIPEEEPDAIYLTWEEVGRIFRLDLSEKPHLEKYRDLFVLGCQTGLRFSDFTSIKPEDIRGGFIHKEQEKTDKPVVIPLMDAAREILLNRFGAQMPHVSSPKFNEAIKELARMAGITELVKHTHKKGNKNIVEVRPKYEWVTSHTCRRSFCTNEFLAGTPVELIMKISGHKNVRDFYRYIRITEEEAARRVRDIWEKRTGAGILMQVPDLIAV